MPVMLIPFMFDRSPTAKLIKSIDSADRLPGQLEQLQTIMKKDILKMPYGYLEQARRRAESILALAKDDVEKDLLQDIYMSALRRIQRTHMESRP
jgi:hypothetical protein